MPAPSRPISRRTFFAAAGLAALARCAAAPRSGRLSGAGAAAHRAVSRRRCRRCGRPADRQGVGRHRGRAGGDRQSRRRRRRHRHGRGRARGTGRLHADPFAQRLDRDAGALPRSAVRPGAGLCRRGDDGVRRLCAGGRTGRAVRLGRRPHHLRQGASRQDHLCVGRHRIDRASRQRVLQAGGGDRSPAYSLQRCCAGADGRGRRPGQHDVCTRGDEPSACRRGANSRAGHHFGATLRACPEPAGHRRNPCRASMSPAGMALRFRPARRPPRSRNSMPT